MTTTKQPTQKEHYHNRESARRTVVAALVRNIPMDDTLLEELALAIHERNQIVRKIREIARVIGTKAIRQ